MSKELRTKLNQSYFFDEGFDFSILGYALHTEAVIYDFQQFVHELVNVEVDGRVDDLSDEEYMDILGEKTDELVQTLKESNFDGLVPPVFMEGLEDEKE